MKRHKKHIKNGNNWWEWIKDKVRICTRRADWSIWFYWMGHEKVARLPFCTCPCYCINFCIYAMLRTRATFSWPILYIQDRSMLCRTMEYSRDVRNCWVGSRCPLANWLSSWRTERKWGNFQTAALLDYLRRCMWDDPLYSVHASFASNCRTSHNLCRDKESQIIIRVLGELHFQEIQCCAVLHLQTSCHRYWL